MNNCALRARLSAGSVGKFGAVLTINSCKPRPAPTQTGYKVKARDLDERTDHWCETVTTTEWKTTTTTKDVTVIKSSVTTKTVLVPTTVAVPTTIEDTETVTQVRTTSETVWVPTTYTQTTTYSTTYPVTVTRDHTVVTTSVATEYITTVSTYTTSVPVVTEVTKVVTQTATVTAPGQDTTVTLPGETKTLPGETKTLPGETKTLPGQTVVTTVTTSLPGQTVTVTKDGQTITTTLPGTTVVTTTTVVIGPTTVTVPGGTATVTSVFDVTLCPSPTGATKPLPTDSDLTFGCKPGYVCNPPKPKGCNLWPDPPSKDYVCNPQECIPAPAFKKVTWPPNETSYYPPQDGYFNLNPEAFGLSYDIFDYKLCEKVINGHKTTITTGNWQSQASLSQWPKPSASPSGYDKHRRELHTLNKRAITPGVCFADCNNAWVIAQSIGKTDALCKAGSDFQQAYAICAKCVTDNEKDIKGTIRDYIGPSLLSTSTIAPAQEPSRRQAPPRRLTVQSRRSRLSERAASRRQAAAISLPFLLRQRRARARRPRHPRRHHHQPRRLSRRRLPHLLRLTHLCLNRHHRRLGQGPLGPRPHQVAPLHPLRALLKQ